MLWASAISVASHVPMKAQILIFPNSAYYMELWNMMTKKQCKLKSPEKKEIKKQKHSDTLQNLTQARCVLIGPLPLAKESNSQLQNDSTAL